MPKVHDPHLVHQMFSGPIPGQSLTHEPKSMPWEKPPQYNTVEEATNAVMDQITEPHVLKPLLALMHGGLPLEAMARTLVFGGFVGGKWTVDVAMLMYKPVLLGLIAIAHRAKIHDVPIVMPDTLEKYRKKQDALMSMISHLQEPAKATPSPTPTPIPPDNSGFMRKQ